MYTSLNKLVTTGPEADTANKAKGQFIAFKKKIVFYSSVFGL